MCGLGFSVLRIDLRFVNEIEMCGLGFSVLRIDLRFVNEMRCAD